MPPTPLFPPNSPSPSRHLKGAATNNCSSYHSRYGQEQSKRHYQLREYSLITLIWRLYAARLGKNDNDVCKNARFDEITDGSYHHIIGNCLHTWRDKKEASLSFTSISCICSVLW